MAITPKISLIIPVYNKAPFLRRCLDSIEPVDGLEVIIVEDCSTDGSREILDEYAGKFEVFKLRKNHGVSYARNYGMSKAKGLYLAFLDADDELEPGATHSFVKMAQNEMSHNIIQFGHFVVKDRRKLSRSFRRRFYGLAEMPPNKWMLVWNKLYRREFIEKIGVKFREDLTFGEDELFNLECLVQNGGMWNINKPLMTHNLDDNDSICRGGLCLEWLQTLDKELKDRMEKESNYAVKSWLQSVILRHESSTTFRKLGFKPEVKERAGKYDVVYLLKDTPQNEELVYSLRSVVENFPHKRVVFCGGKPKNLEPDLHIVAEQGMPSKWENTRKMLRQIADDDRISEDFWLFNDDFFVLRPKNDSMPPQYYGTIQEVIEKTERNFHRPIDWTRRLKHLIATLEAEGKGTLNYAVHKPMLINRAKLAEVLDKFPDEPMTRALYGNYYEIGGIDSTDMKVKVQNYNIKKVVENWDFVSTQDDSFATGNIGEYLRGRFSIPSRFETGDEGVV